MRYFIIYDKNDLIIGGFFMTTDPKFTSDDLNNFDWENNNFEDSTEELFNTYNDSLFICKYENGQIVETTDPKDPPE